MPYLLRFNESNTDEFVSGLDIDILSRTSWRLEFTIAIDPAFDSFEVINILGKENNDRASVYIQKGGNFAGNFDVVVRTIGGSTATKFTADFISSYTNGEPQEYVLTRDGDDRTCTIEGNSFGGTLTQSEVAVNNSTTIGRRDSSYSKQVDLYRLEGYDATTGGTKLFDYDPSLSGGTGTILTDAENADNGTLENFDGTTDSWWIEYGSTAITADGAITLPSLVFAGSATDSTSEVTAAGDITLPSLVFAGSATDSTSEVTAAGDITLPSLVFAGSATDSTSEVTAAGDITLPSLVFAGSATDSTSEITAAGDITLPSLVFAGSATDSTSEVTATGDITLPSLVFAGSASTSEVGQVTAAGDVTLPSLVFAGSATDTTSELTATGAITLPSLVFQGNASDSTSEVTAAGDITLPSLVFAGSATDTETTEVTASGAITLPSLVFQGSATDSTSEVTVSGAITLPSLVFAGNATAGQVISDFTIQIDNTAKIIETTPNSFTIRI